MEFVTPTSLQQSEDHFDDNSMVVVISKYGVLSAAPVWLPFTARQWRSLAGAIAYKDKVLHWLGHLDSRSCYAVYIEDEDLSGAAEHGEYQWLELRSILSQVETAYFELVNRAAQVCHWDRNHRFCGHCGSPTDYHIHDRARSCSACGLSSYPRIMPCIIVLVKKGEHVLLARNARTQSPMFSILAGFVEAGESAEQCLHREVFEEAGIKVHNLQYFSSQAWPFPGQLMLGFTADYLSGELQAAEDELLEANWFHYKDLPLVPPNFTVSGQLIEHFCQQQEQQ